MSEDYVVNVRELSKSFNAKKVVDNISLQVKRGEIYGFLGPNGSGKTTTIRLICGLLKPDCGVGECLGYNILTQSNLIKCNVGYMTQRFSLYEDLTIEENLDFVARLYAIENRKQAVQESIEGLGIGSQRKKQLAGELSGGWKQRLALAAATIHKPSLLLLDEPTAGVDPKARREFWDEIHRLASTGVTAFVTTHYMDEAERCHHLAYIAYGKLIAEGKIEEVIRQAGLIVFEVKGDALAELSKILSERKGVLQVANFGQALHVCGDDESLLQQAIKPYQTASLIWSRVEVSLEDVFIYYMSQSRDNYL
jgi:ABC-2 type transport system ATP-binding protein